MKRKRSIARQEDGFTLLELIIAMTVVAVIAVLSVFSVRLAVSSQKAGGDKAELYQRLRFIGEQLTEKIASAHPFFLLGKENLPLFARIDPEQLKGKRILAFEGGPESVKFITTAGRLNDIGVESPDFHEVRFFLGKNPKTKETGVILVEKPLSFDTALQDTPESLADAQYITLAPQAAKLKFRYLRINAVEGEGEQPGKKTVKYTEEWVDTIKTEPIEFSGKTSQSLFQSSNGAEGRMSLPRAIEISLSLKEGNADGDDDEFLGEEEEEQEGLIALPAVIIPTHTGQVFERAAIPEDQQDQEKQEEQKKG
ncbi:MAG: type II secretion system protein [Nitrospina sp.]|nr:type II secretion system protein [Nitrospina sp.]